MSRVEIAAREELNRLLKDGVTKEELEQAKEGYLQARKVGRTSDQALTGILSSLRQRERTMAFEAEMDQKIEALTPEEVSTAWRNHIDATKLAVVVAGDFGAKTGAEP